MLLGITFFVLLLAMAALATPVPGKEIGVIRETSNEINRRVVLRGDFYKPDLHKFCSDAGYSYCHHGVNCINTIRFRFECAHGCGEPGPTYTLERECRYEYFCVPLQTGPGRFNHIASPEYIGERSIACLKTGQELQIKVPDDKPQAKTPLSKKPAGPSGYMVGTYELKGDIKGLRPSMEWRFVSPQEPGENLLGQHIISHAESERKNNVYSISYNFDNHAQVFVDVDYLSPKHGDIYLHASLAVFSSPFHLLEERRDLEEGEDLGREAFKDEEVSGN